VEPVIHFYNPSTGLNVFRTVDGEFWSGWKLKPKQVWDVLHDGRLGGG
jgi:Colicin D